MVKAQSVLTVVLVAVAVLFSKEEAGARSLLGDLWQDTLILSKPESLLVHTKVKKWLLDSLQIKRVNKVEVYAQKYSEVWQYGEGIDSIQGGIKLFRYELNPKIFTEEEPTIHIHKCGFMACGPNAGYLLLDKKKSIRLLCGYTKGSNEIRLAIPIEKQICAKVVYNLKGQQSILIGEELELNKENRKTHQKYLPLITVD